MTQELTAQTIFDTVVDHLFTQGRPAVAGNGFCAYRGANGAKCAVGILIPDDLYDPKMDNMDNADDGNGYGVSMLLNTFGLLNFLRPHTKLLWGLQDTHDENLSGFERQTENFDLKRLKMWLEDIARMHRLDATNLDNRAKEHAV